MRGLKIQIRRTALALALIALAGAVSAASLPGSTRLALLPQAWTDDSGKPLALTSLTGETVVLTMAYANCHRVCPMTIDQLKRLQASFDAAGRKAEFVIVGYDPENENAATWRDYRKSHRLNRSNWHFITGSLEDTTRLARALNFELWKYDEHVMHDSHVLLFDPDGVLAHELDPAATDPS